MDSDEKITNTISSEDNENGEIRHILSSLLEDICRCEEDPSGQHHGQRRFVSAPDVRWQRNRGSKITGGELINSSTAMHNEMHMRTPSSKISVPRVPPSYSTVIAFGPPIAIFPANYSSLSFITPRPPPSYAEVHGIWDDPPSDVSSDSYSLGPDPIYASCPRCRTMVRTDVHTSRSQLAYVASAFLCLCLCWPCCLLPVWLKPCQNFYHFCPVCHYYMGAYRPC
ncbi:lipopolysaccharide-induced tumor necrosis factor-alpha factor homolog isoform X1 [Cylas formicarius]|uniref:lipopolysaccharide-induced tumor necrosis factor-alpha factor homolog isoform X1 n=1 Tax=Cylas formicarius TaxID=197179 RepID=UPI002958581A|nr:lipopolysaccharide-induced tumor necrosis factor-alpha factor homolog isoform X1 [Cylas formicarius]